MNTLNKEQKASKEFRFPYMTDHYVERYFERILVEPKPEYCNKDIYKKIYIDMNDRMSVKEIGFMELFAKSSEALIPMGQFNKIVIRNNTLITVY